MKIDTDSPRLPIDKLKHPLRQKSLPSADENKIDTGEKLNFSETFEREIVLDGAKRFKKWLEKIEIK